MAKGFNGLFQMVINEAKLQNGDDFNTSETSLWYKLMAPLVLSCTYLEDKAISLKSARNIYTAQGVELDDMFTNDLLFRIQGAHSTGSATITGNSGTSVDIGSITVLGSNNLLYTNIETGIIANETLILKFKCITMGTNGDLPPNNFTSVQSAPTGIRDVENSQISGGLNVETDYEYMQRYLSAIKDKDWSLPAILSAIRQLNGVKSCDGIRNNTNTDGVNGIEKKSIKIVVDGGDEQEIANTIYLRTHTANTLGNVVKQVKMTETNFEEVRFDRPTTTPIDFKYVIISPDKDKILELLKEYLNETKIGDIVSVEEFRKLKIEGYLLVNMTVLSVEFKRDSEQTYKPFIQLNYFEKGSAGTGVDGNVI